jgi:hypothetical protein
MSNQTQTNTPELKFYPIKGYFPLSNSHSTLCRAKIPGGWLVELLTHPAFGICFVPDPYHQWDGGSLDSANPDLKKP